MDTSLSAPTFGSTPSSAKELISDTDDFSIISGTDRPQKSYSISVVSSLHHDDQKRGRRAVSSQAGRKVPQMLDTARKVVRNKLVSMEEAYMPRLC